MKLPGHAAAAVLVTVAFICYTAGYFFGQRAAGEGYTITVTNPEGQDLNETLKYPDMETDCSNSAAVDINKAGQEELETLPGIGEELARRIIEHRASCGGFRYKDEIMDVEGIGQSKYDELKELIKVD